MGPIKSIPSRKYFEDNFCTRNIALFPRKIRRRILEYHIQHFGNFYNPGDYNLYHFYGKFKEHDDVFLVFPNICFSDQYYVKEMKRSWFNHIPTELNYLRIIPDTGYVNIPDCKIPPLFLSSCKKMKYISLQSIENLQFVTTHEKMKNMRNGLTHIQFNPQIVSENGNPNEPDSPYLDRPRMSIFTKENFPNLRKLTLQSADFPERNRDAVKELIKMDYLEELFFLNCNFLPDFREFLRSPMKRLKKLVFESCNFMKFTEELLSVVENHDESLKQQQEDDHYPKNLEHLVFYQPRILLSHRSIDTCIDTFPGYLLNYICRCKKLKHFGTSLPLNENTTAFTIFENPENLKIVLYVMIGRHNDMEIENMKHLLFNVGINDICGEVWKDNLQKRNFYGDNFVKMFQHSEFLKNCSYRKMIVDEEWKKIPYRVILYILSFHEIKMSDLPSDRKSDEENNCFEKIVNHLVGYFQRDMLKKQFLLFTSLSINSIEVKDIQILFEKLSRLGLGNLRFTTFSKTRVLFSEHQIEKDMKTFDFLRTVENFDTQVQIHFAKKSVEDTSAFSRFFKVLQEKGERLSTLNVVIETQRDGEENFSNLDYECLNTRYEFLKPLENLKKINFQVGFSSLNENNEIPEDYKKLYVSQCLRFPFIFHDDQCKTLQSVKLTYFHIDLSPEMKDHWKFLFFENLREIDLSSGVIVKDSSNSRSSMGNLYCSFLLKIFNKVKLLKKFSMLLTTVHGERPVVSISKMDLENAILFSSSSVDNNNRVFPVNCRMEDLSLMNIVLPVEFMELIVKELDIVNRENMGSCSCLRVLELQSCGISDEHISVLSRSEKWGKSDIFQLRIHNQVTAGQTFVNTVSEDGLRDLKRRKKYKTCCNFDPLNF